MNLALHQLRKDVWQFRYILAGLYAILLWDLAVQQGMTTRDAWTWPFDIRDLFGIGLPWTIGAIVGAGCVMAFASVFADSSLRENAFIRTRPMPTRSLWLSKLLFVGVIIGLPVILIETVNLALHGLPAALVWAGTWERITIAIPVLLFISAIGGSVSEQKTPAVMVAGGYGVVLIGIGLLALYAEIRGIHLREPDGTGVRYGLATWAVLMAAYAIWVHRRQRPTRPARAVAFVGLLWAGLFMACFGPGNPQVNAKAQAEVTEAVATAKFTIPINGLTRSSGEPEGDMLRIGWSVTPEVSGLPKGWFVRWGSCTATLETGDGKVRNAASYLGRSLIFQRYYNLSMPDLQSIGEQIPENALLESSDSHSGLPAMSSQTFFLPPDGDWWDQTASLTVRGVGNMYRWRQLASLELKVGATIKEGATSWRIAGVGGLEDGSTLDLVFEQKGVGLQMSADQDLGDAGRWPANRYEFLIYDPVNELCRGLDHRSPNSGRRGVHSAFQSRSAILRFQEGRLRQKGWRESFDQLRLLVFRLEYLGSFEHSEEVAFVPAEFQNSYYSSSRQHRAERIGRDEYIRRFSQLEAPALDAGRGAIGNYVFECLQLVEAQRRLDEADPVIRKLAEYVATEPELFLDGYHVAESDARRALEFALLAGLQPEHKELLIDRLPQHPQLAHFLIKRGWHEESKEALFDLLDFPMSLPYSTLKALSWFDDPRVDERLLAEVRHRWGFNGYQVASRVPRLADRLDSVIAERWNNRSKVYDARGGSDNVLNLALKHGRVDALNYFLRVLRLHNSKRGSLDHGAMQTLGEMLEIPGLTRRDRYDDAKIRAALLALGNAEFEYDPVFRKYRVAEAGE